MLNTKTQGNFVEMKLHSQRTLSNLQTPLVHCDGIFEMQNHLIVILSESKIHFTGKQKGH